MIVDTSALLAIAWDEPERSRFQDALEAATSRLISAASFLEAGIVMIRRVGPDAADEALRILDELLDQLGLDIEPVTATQARLALDAYRRFGKGLDPAGLNFGDLFAYALAKETGQPLLFKGTDFARTDVDRAI